MGLTPVSRMVFGDIDKGYKWTRVAFRASRKPIEVFIYDIVGIRAMAVGAASAVPPRNRIGDFIARRRIPVHPTWSG